MDQLQSDGKAWQRYYAISSDWVQAWLAYVQANDKSTAKNPGPIDNGKLTQTLLKQRDNKEGQNSTLYYSVSKHLFYYFHALYGGGPALVQNSFWQSLEVQYSPMQEGEPIEETKQPNASSRRVPQQ